LAQLHLSNLQLRSNLLSVNYQKEMTKVTAFEFKDILRRNELLINELTPKQREEWTARLFDGDTSVSMSERDRGRAWLEQLAERVEEVLGSLKDRADEERTFEVLCIAESLAAPGLDSTYAAKAREWAQRARAILGRAEFRLTPQMIDDRLTQVLGEAEWRGASEQHPGPPAPAAQQTASIAGGE
jgi:hypothetical protein